MSIVLTRQTPRGRRICCRRFKHIVVVVRYSAVLGTLCEMARSCDGKPQKLDLETQGSASVVVAAPALDETVVAKKLAIQLAAVNIQFQQSRLEKRLDAEAGDRLRF